MIAPKGVKRRDEPVVIERRSPPILFSAPMVNALLGGHRTQTRRVLFPWSPSCAHDAATRIIAHRGRPYVSRLAQIKGLEGLFETKRCVLPMWAGDTPWVREAFQTWALSGAGEPMRIRYVADGSTRDVDRGPDDYVSSVGTIGPDRHMPGMFMPRWASRLSLSVVSVRVERLQDITEEDAQAEGLCEEVMMHFPAPIADRMRVEGSHRERFRIGWDALNGARSPWANNDFVAVCSFAPGGST